MCRAIADDCIDHNVDVLLCPGVNIKRTPFCGRNFTYYDERTHSWQTEQGGVSLYVCKNANEIVTEFLL